MTVAILPSAGQASRPGTRTGMFQCQFHSGHARSLLSQDGCSNLRGALRKFSILFLLAARFALHLRHLLCETSRVFFVLNIVHSECSEHVV
jgi:hypothetical protein